MARPRTRRHRRLGFFDYSKPAGVEIFGTRNYFFRPFDDDKARLDAFAIELQNHPDAQGYVILYQGTDKVSKRSRNADKIGKRTLDYLVKVRGVDPRRIMITNWGTRPKTRYELWVIPPGAQPPVPQK